MAFLARYGNIPPEPGLEEDVLVAVAKEVGRFKRADDEVLVTLATTVARAAAGGRVA